MTTAKRFRHRWTINECLQLQREFELLKLSIDEIATRHQRTPNAIMLKLNQEGFADYNVLYSNYYGLNSTIPVANSATHKDADVQDDDNSSDYENNESQEDDDESQEDDDEEQEDDDYKTLKTQVAALEKQINMLTEMFMKNNNKSVFSLFS